MQRSETVISELIKLSIIPEYDEFIITERLIDEYQQTYTSVFEPKHGNFKSSNMKYNRKLAGLFLLKENQSRVNKTEEIRVSNKKYKTECGIIYLISNPAFSGCFKVGLTKNLEKRLNAYQTCDPNRSYKVEHYKFVNDLRLTEKLLLEKFKIDIVKGEWVKNEKIKSVLLEEISNM